MMVDKYHKEFKESGKITGVPYPKLFIDTLLELRDEFIGNLEVKEIMMKHIMTLIMTDEMQDMHTVICGPPGTGKTTLGIIWGKLAKSLGKIDDTPIPNSSNIFSDITPEKIAIFSLVVAGFELGIRSIRGVMELYSLTKNQNMIDNILESQSKKESNFKNNLIKIACVIVVCIVIYYIYKNLKNKKDEHTDLNQINSDDIVKVVQRKDFIGEYIGQTEPKTDNLLNSSVGKVLFIDEAYSLAPDGSNRKHDFGSIACTQINEFMSKYSTKVVIIFAGYENEIKDTLFANQPGFERRVKYNFIMKPYTSDELWRIFLSQIKRKDYDLKREEIELIYQDVFRGNVKLFEKGQGGDMAKLRDFAINAKTSRDAKKYLQGLERNKDKILTYEDIEDAISTFKKNKVGSDKKRNTPTYNNFFSNLEKYVNQESLQNFNPPTEIIEVE